MIFLKKVLYYFFTAIACIFAFLFTIFAGIGESLKDDIEQYDLEKNT